MATFSKFALLPTELRVEIWEMAAAAAEYRIIQIQADFRLTTRKAKATKLKTKKQKYPVPALVHACIESRASARYRRAFKTILYPRYIWVNLDSDTIEINGSALAWAWLEKPAIRYLRVRPSFEAPTLWTEASEAELEQICYHFKKLRVIDLILSWMPFHDWPYVVEGHLRFLQPLPRLNEGKEQWIDMRVLSPLYC